MNQSIHRLFILILIVLLYSCGDPQPQVENKTFQKPRQTLAYSSVELFSIDQSIYYKEDTISDFPDGTHAYEDFFRGAAFIDSQGHPIHKLYRKFVLTPKQNRLLMDSFLYKFCDNTGRACTPVYRDVLIFYDSSHHIIQQAQICFGCHFATIYPRREFMCQEESDLNYDNLQKFVSEIKR